MEPEIVMLLEEILEQRGKTKYWLAKQTGINYGIINKYYKNEAKRYDKINLLRICLALDCQVGDILKIV